MFMNLWNPMHWEFIIKFNAEKIGFSLLKINGDDLELIAQFEKKRWIIVKSIVLKFVKESLIVEFAIRYLSSSNQRFVSFRRVFYWYILIVRFQWTELGDRSECMISINHVAVPILNWFHALHQNETVTKAGFCIHHYQNIFVTCENII
jgi:hypothetical protein